jgi:2-polyprenyl-6-methoxyphenol hydroxylase-like FAD-dependent oxidoreductase
VDADVIVVGGAVAGSAVANALGSHGISTLVLEKVSREVHSTRGDLLHPATLRILERWGVLEHLHADGSLPITQLAVTHNQRGLIASFALDAADNGPAGRTIAVPHDRIEAITFEHALSVSGVRAMRGTVVAPLYDDSGRVCGVSVRIRGAAQAIPLHARLVVACDGAQSSLRRLVGIEAVRYPYEHEQIIIAAEGQTEPPAALHWHIDDVGTLCIVSRPGGRCRILLTLPLGARGDLLRQPDPALHDYVAGRFPTLGHLRIERSAAHVYRLSRHVAESFWRPGVALVGDAAHATHPAGATGMSLAITGADELAELVAPALSSGAPDAELDALLAAYDAERRPAANAAVAANHQQALRLWQSELFRDPQAYAAAVNPSSGWGANAAAWGQNPAMDRRSRSQVA